MAETTLRELGRPSLSDLLELTLLIAQKDPRRYPRVSARWLIRYLEQHDQATIDDAAFAVACLEAVAGPENEHAVTALRDMAEKAARPSAQIGGRAANPPFRHQVFPRPTPSP